MELAKKHIKKWMANATDDSRSLQKHYKSADKTRQILEDMKHYSDWDEAGRFILV